MTRKLSLARDVLHELTSEELAGVAGGNTNVSCLDYLSCWFYQCLPTFDRRCID